MKKEDSLKLSEYVFSEPYSHLDINTVDDTIYRNFNKLEISK